MKKIASRMAAALLAALLTSQAWAGEFFEVDGLALRGYDPVAYVEADRPTAGDPAHAFTYQGSKFLFASAANRAKFIAAPEKYAPQFRGYCALGTANGYKVATEPDAFKVVDGKLYLNYNRKVLDIWSKDTAGYIAKANENWPTVSKMPAKQ
jgi:YHS domain-containing protein